MWGHLQTTLLAVAVLTGGIVPSPLAQTPDANGHACCQMVGQAHAGCVQVAMRCCRAPDEPRRDAPGAPASAPAVHLPDFTVLKGHAAHVAGLPAQARSSATHAFVSTHLQLPRDPLYLRHLVLLV